LVRRHASARHRTLRRLSRGEYTLWSYVRAARIECPASDTVPRRTRLRRRSPGPPRQAGFSERVSYTHKADELTNRFCYRGKLTLNPDPLACGVLIRGAVARLAEDFDPHALTGATACWRLRPSFLIWRKVAPGAFRNPRTRRDRTRRQKARLLPANSRVCRGWLPASHWRKVAPGAFRSPRTRRDGTRGRVAVGFTASLR
jgi:hypothetical protein